MARRSSKPKARRKPMPKPSRPFVDKRKMGNKWNRSYRLIRESLRRDGFDV